MKYLCGWAALVIGICCAGGYAEEPAFKLPAPDANGNIAIFNGKDLAGWEGAADMWRVEDGEIVGQHKGRANNEFLFSKFEASDFRLTLRIKLVNNDDGNSGVQFRSRKLPPHEAKGYQADVGKGWWGKLYEESARGLLVKEGGEQFVKKGDWNTYEILAIGHRIKMALNGHVVVDFEDPKGDLKGLFAMQVHSGPPTEVRFKDLALQLNPKPELLTVKK
jgi:Domain of Unknown Function (DUF1080)